MRNIAMNMAKVTNVVETAVTCQRNSSSEIKITIKYTLMGSLFQGCSIMTRNIQ